MNTGSQVYRITGMDCAECARTLEIGVSKLDGVASCSLSYATAKLHVSGEVAPAAIIERVRKLGYDVEEGTKAKAEAKREGETEAKGGLRGFVAYLLQRRSTTLTLIAGLLILPALVFDELLPMLGVSSPIFALMSLTALVLAGAPIAQNAWRALIINHRITINLLMTIAALGAVMLGAYGEAGLVMVLFALGEALEGYTMTQARDGIRTLMDAAPNRAIVLRPCIDCRGHMGQDGYNGGPCPFCGLEEQSVEVGDLRIGETIIVKPGERIAMDGRISAGASTVNQAPITGESTPVEKIAGDDAFAGSINGEGVLEIEVTHLAADNTINRIITLVEEAQERKAPTERMIDRFAQWYTPAVMVLALLVAIVPPLLWGAAFWGEQGWFYRALELLVIACPCALVISTPVTLISAISNAAQHGVLIKGGAVLETLARVQAVAFDKTGTLTNGQPSLVRIQAVDCTSPGDECAQCNDLLALASALERRSEHPLAHAIVQAAAVRGIESRYPPAEHVMAITGKGVVGAVNGSEVLIGSHGYFDHAVTHDPAICTEIGALTGSGYTALLVSENGRYRGYALTTDLLRDSSRAAVTELHAAGVQTTVMLTGDHAATAQVIAGQAGVPRCAPICCRSRSWMQSTICLPAMAWWRWWATASTMRQRWPRRRWGWRWARAPHRRWRPRTWP
jgi:Cd2+/Zn2+-exporting ATPase